MTHYDAPGVGAARRRPNSLWEKSLGYARNLSMPRPQCSSDPGRWDLPYETVRYAGAEHQELEAWHVAGEAAHPTVLLFHGYGGCKSNLLGAAREFHQCGCESWLVDFHGNGGSSGRTTTIGYAEADDVLATLREADAGRSRKQPTILYGTSMGAAAILCAVHRYHIAPDALILECPYDRLVTTVGNRCRMLGLPAFPSADLVVLWGGVQQGFNGFGMNPVEYARDVRCPTLLLQGECDERVGLEHAREIAKALGEHGTFDLFPGAGHTLPVREKWREDVRKFLVANRLATKAN
jgi:alpha-beta hydrolase superfamily lysophospholipase